MQTNTSLKARAVRQMATTLVVLAAILFLSAGSLRFWEAWLFVGLQAGLWTLFFIDFLKHDPHLLEGRLQTNEKEPTQQVFQKLFKVILIPAFILTGFDFRWGWSRAWLGPVPVAVVIVGQVVVVAGYCLVFWVMKTNTFAASTIQVEAKQTVIHNGPYALVRHPMYSGMVVTVLAVPLALGSYVTFPLFALLVPLLVYRLTHEERTLRRALPGYADYCESTRFRLVPWVW